MYYHFIVILFHICFFHNLMHAFIVFMPLGRNFNVDRNVTKMKIPLLLLNLTFVSVCVICPKMSRTKHSCTCSQIK